MRVDLETALQNLSSVSQEFHYLLRENSPEDYRVSGLIVRMRAALDRLAPPDSPYAKVLKLDYGVPHVEMQALGGAIEALFRDYSAGFLRTFREQMSIEASGDFLLMAEQFLENEHLKHPAAVLAGGVLERHLRNLCGKNGIATEATSNDGRTYPKNVEQMNGELRKANVYSLNDQKQVTAWYGIRNSAAHARLEEFEAVQVEIMIQGIRSFLSRFPA